MNNFLMHKFQIVIIFITMVVVEEILFQFITFTLINMVCKLLKLILIILVQIITNNKVAHLINLKLFGEILVEEELKKEILKVCNWPFQMHLSLLDLMDLLPHYNSIMEEFLMILIVGNLIIILLFQLDIILQIVQIPIGPLKVLGELVGEIRDMVKLKLFLGKEFVEFKLLLQLLIDSSQNQKINVRIIDLLYA